MVSVIFVPGGTLWDSKSARGGAWAAIAIGLYLRKEMGEEGRQGEELATT